MASRRPDFEPLHAASVVEGIRDILDSENNPTGYVLDASDSTGPFRLVFIV